MVAIWLPLMVIPTRLLFTSVSSHHYTCTRAHLYGWLGADGRLFFYLFLNNGNIGFKDYKDMREYW
jgi:hypothetical protein